MEVPVQQNPETKYDSLIAKTSTFNPETPQELSSMEVHVKENPETKMDYFFAQTSRINPQANIDSLYAETSTINPETPQESSSMNDSSNPNPEFQYYTCENRGEMATSYSYGAFLCKDCERDYVSVYAGLVDSLMKVPVKENPETKDESSIAEASTHYPETRGESSSMGDSTKQNPENWLNCDEKYHNLNFRFSTHIRFYLNHPNENPQTPNISSMAETSKPTPETSKLGFLLKSALGALSYLTVMEHNCGMSEVTERGLLISTGCSKEVNILGNLRLHLKADGLFCFCCFTPIKNLIDLTDFTNQVSAANDDDEINAYHYHGSSVIHFITVAVTDHDDTLNVGHFKESSEVPFVTGILSISKDKPQTYQESSSGTDQPTLGPGDQESSSGTDQPTLEPGEQKTSYSLEDTTIFSSESFHATRGTNLISGGGGGGGDCGGGGAAAGGGGNGGVGGDDGGGGGEESDDGDFWEVRIPVINRELKPFQPVRCGNLVGNFDTVKEVEEAVSLLLHKKYPELIHHSIIGYVSDQGQLLDPDTDGLFFWGF